MISFLNAYNKRYFFILYVVLFQFDGFLFCVFSFFSKERNQSFEFLGMWGHLGLGFPFHTVGSVRYVTPSVIPIRTI
jgi:hypothetical protein